MFIDTSALFAIIAGEPEQSSFSSAIERASSRYISGPVRLETVMALSRGRSGKAAENIVAVERLIAFFGLETLPITEDVSKVAVEAFRKFGRGSRHPAKLNLSDCMTYAAAKHYRLPLLCKGDDFPQTDIELVRFTA